MKQELENELILALMPHVRGEDLDIVKMTVTMILNKYDISLQETHLTVYEGDINEIMVKKFLMAKVASGLSPRTIDYYKKELYKILQEIGKPYTDITSDDIRFYLAIRVQRGKITKTTANNDRRALSTFYGWLQKEEILLKNPMAKVEALKETKKKKKAYSLLDLEKIRIGCRTNREKAIVEMLTSTWCRVSELCKIRRDEIADGKCVVHGKGDKEREVYINARAALVVELYLKERTDGNPYLFPKAKYTVSEIKDIQDEAYRATITKLRENWYKDRSAVHETDPIDKGTIESVVRKLGKRVGVSNVHPHRFRRTGATLALRQGMPLITVSKLLGHNNIQTTQIYLDISDEELEQMHRKYVT